MRIHSALDDIYSGYVTSQVDSPVQRVYHNDPSCRVCRHGKDGFLLTSAIPAPYPNPERHPQFQKEVQGGPTGTHWYHGTNWTPDTDDELGNDERKKEMEKLQSPSGDPKTNEYGERGEKHWNTDLGTHFSSIKNVARSFANGGWASDPNGRIAHASLHMKNPKQYKNEDDFGRDAVRHALSQGKTFLPNNERARKDFTTGRDMMDSPGTAGQDNERNYYLNSVQNGGVSPQGLASVDKYGPDAKHGPHSKYPGAPINSTDHIEQWLTHHPDREQINDNFRKHLLSQGHDGVVYGNSIEGPQDHPSAIAFPETPVGIHHWEYLNKPDEPEPVKSASHVNHNQHALF